MKVLVLFALCALASAAPRPRASDCDQCKQIVQYVDSKLTANSTETEIEDFIDKICSALGSAAEECKSYVGQYVPEVLKMVVAHIKPEQICMELHLCNKTRHEIFLGPGPVIGGTGLKIPGFQGDKPIMPSKIELPEPAVQVKSPQGEGCVICEFVMKEIQSLISSNASEAEIEAALDKVCNILPSTIRTECTNFVNQYAPQIIQLLAQKLDPQQICTALKLCTSSLPKTQPSVRAGPLCPICEQVLKYVDSLLANNATDQQILETIERICDYLPQADQSQCKTLIEDEGEKIIQMLVNKLNPEQVCEAIKLC